MNKKNDIVDFYKFVKNNKQKVDKSFNNHHIEPASHILCIGGSGSGKSTSLLNFIAKTDKFHRIMIYAPTSDPLYDLLIEKIPEVEMYNDIKEFPPLSDMDDEDNDVEKLIVFDDFITLTPKEQNKIKEYMIAGRKKNCTCFLMAQNYPSVNKTISRNINYFIIFKLNDNVSINNIIKNHNVDDVDKEIIKDAYKYCTLEPKNFMMIDLKDGTGKKRFRKNFTEFLKLK
jgi:DNA polymerase III delta prime subunit